MEGGGFQEFSLQPTYADVVHGLHAHIRVHVRLRLLCFCLAAAASTVFLEVTSPETFLWLLLMMLCDHAQLCLNLHVSLLLLSGSLCSHCQSVCRSAQQVHVSVWWNLRGQSQLPKFMSLFRRELRVSHQIKVLSTYFCLFCPLHTHISALSTSGKI